jgi:predicted NUDIX family NTP pyrophosphohydrolase
VERVVTLQGRMVGKRHYMDLLLERQLASGLKVLVVSPAGAFFYRRYGHLTSITKMPQGPEPIIWSY